jgi:acetyl-CoA carboxylase biotin carboxylase subunit
MSATPLPSLRPVQRLFIANRGEIALRILRAARSLNLEVVIGVSEADRHTQAARLADRAVCIGPAPALESYLNRNAIVQAAMGTGCDAIHPGYGFLSERAVFQRLCVENGITFVGPTAEAIEAVGDKLAARRIAETIGVPTVPGTDHVKSADDALAFAERAGYPFLFKASAGGGGRGMRVVRKPDEVASAFNGASAEAGSAFGDPTLFIERYIERARHIEIQIIADAYGNIVHLGERDCSTQRRHQKVIEEGPSPLLSEEKRQQMGEAAVKLMRHVGYRNAGTVEFILDMDTSDFYFLEVNTRIQVEHPVTEMITGTDLVAEQIRVAGGESLSFAQEDIRISGHAIECRINAENPRKGFMPSPGRITRWQAPQGEGVRLDSHCEEGGMIPPYYDSMIGKLIVHGRDRAEAVARMRVALSSFQIEGIQTTIPFHLAVLAHPDFIENRVTTRWTEETFIRQFMAAKAAPENAT